MNIGSKLDTATPYLQGLIQDIAKGEIKIPKFQRPFVWGNNKALELLDSISQNYPIGSLLLWKTASKLVAERDIGDFKLPETADLTPTSYVLDGQQRLTVIYSCLGAPLNEGGFKAGYDLIKLTFLELPKVHQVHIFPLRLLYVTSQLLDYRTALKSHPDNEVLQERLDSLIEVFTTYKVPVVTLRDLTVEEVCPIFERINSSGTRLSTYDLMVAATWSKTFDLNNETERISLALAPKGFSDIKGDTVIKCLSAIHKKSAVRDDILALRTLDSSAIQALSTESQNALLKAVDLLSTEFKIYSWDFLPYEALVVILCSIFSEVKNLDNNQVQRLRQWFWRASYSERYRGASENFISSDIKAVQEFIINGIGLAETFGDVLSTSTLRNVEFRSNNSRSRAFILTLATRNPRNLTNGASIDTSEALSAFNKKQYHHIYPKGFLKRINIVEGQNSLVNICMLSASENNRIGDKDPREYLPESVETLGAEAESVFASNYMPSPAEFNYRELNFPDFLDMRAILLSDSIDKLCNGAAI